MKNILITIKNNCIFFKERKKLSMEHKSNLNNVIDSNVLIFTEDYITANKKVITSFLIGLCQTNKIDCACIENSSLYLLILDLLQKNTYITSLILKDEEPLTYQLCEMITSSSITSVSCYNLQSFMLEYLDKSGILVESRNEILFLSNFMLENNLSIFSSLFYKMSLKMDFPMSHQDEEDFQTFCKINKYLKTIHVNMASLSDFEFIIETLKSTSKKNIKIIIHDNITDSDTVKFLKKFNKKQSKKYNIYFKLSYSDEYIKNNIIKQTNSNILRTCGTIIFTIITITFGYVFYDNYISMQNVDDIKDSISHAIEVTDVDQIIKDFNLLEPPVEENPEENPDDKKDTTFKYKITNHDLVALLSINPETVGWLKVNNTNIDYPVVQSTNNQYYLDHNFYLEEDKNGWVFMDHRNSRDDFDDNTIIYAHNRYYNGVMFGTLQNTLRYSWYTNEDNQIIEYRTIYGTYKFKIFSIYKIYKTNDYMSTIFSSDEVKTQFYQMLKERSIYDFGINPTSTDKIITLSTCADDDNRLVVHAVLLSQ